MGALLGLLWARQGCGAAGGAGNGVRGRGEREQGPEQGSFLPLSHIPGPILPHSPLPAPALLPLEGLAEVRGEEQDVGETNRTFQGPTALQGG